MTAVSIICCIFASGSGRNPEANAIQNVTSSPLTVTHDFGPPRADRQARPYGKNLGFWTDEDLTLSDYESHFSISYIEQEEFESRWNQSIGEKMCKEDVLTVLKEWNPLDVPDYIKESEYGNYVSGIMNHDHSYKELHHYIISMLNSMGLDNVAVEETERVAMKIWTLIKS